LTKTKPTTTLVQYKEEKMISKPKELRENKTLSEKQLTQYENRYKQRTHNTEACNRVRFFIFLFWALWFQNLWNDEEEPKPRKKQTNKQTLTEEEEEESFNLLNSTLPHKHEHHKTKLKSRTKRK
jgi:hypothetical protein